MAGYTAGPKKDSKKMRAEAREALESARALDPTRGIPLVDPELCASMDLCKRRR